MEVRSEPAIMPSRDSFIVGVQKSPTASPTPLVHNMRMTYSNAAASYPAGGLELPSPQGLNVNAGGSVKKKRGRPRKYAPDGTVALGLSPAPLSTPAAVGSSTGFSLSYGFASTPLPLDSSSLMAGVKKARGRPLGSTKKHLMDTLGLGGIGFTPHVITVKAGEDVSAKIMSFSHHGPRAVCILSANGAISNVTLRQTATSGGTITYEGRFEILSLSGSFLLSESGGQRSRTGGLSVSLAGPDGRVMGGGVAGLLTAASPVQVVVGSFIADGGRKEPRQTNPLEATSSPVKVNHGGMPVSSSPPSRGTLSESSGGGPGSPLNQSANGGGNNSNNGNSNQLSLFNMPWK
ncbi:Putative DNA-binding protein ESCAROLA [Apostasia shenzhenica]|uniref:AT-hook motif nuclear-localized protein n=1 Tax=Apostasia shenzhenica TaxID=1088818 RepID=A0A2I0B3S0_9ASPA|nr:Putative DNA-binding protein ESCAROLA [Apostasia shenzhenica]